MSTAARIDELRKKFEENPRRFFAPLANELRKAGDLTQAIALCREHLPKQPGHMSGYIVFGQALFESGELDEARVVFEQALALDPENLIALHHLGHIARQVGDTATARRWYGRALETDPRNDDIALQLAALATPIRPMPAVPTPPVAVPVVAADGPTAHTPVAEPLEELDFLSLGAIPVRTDLGAIATPPYPQNAVGDLPLAPTPDAAMRAVDFDEINASLRKPESHAFFDLEAIESVGNAMGTESTDAAAVTGATEIAQSSEPIDISFDDLADSAATEPPAVVDVSDDVAVADEALIDGAGEPIAIDAPSGQAMADDPFGFEEAQPTGPSVTPHSSHEPTDAPAPSDLAVEFEEGLVTADWPDTTEFTSRQPTPRQVTPLRVDALPEAAEAFGREPQDPVVAPLPAPEPEVLGEDADLVTSTAVPTPAWTTPAWTPPAPQAALQYIEVDPAEEGTPDVADPVVDIVDHAVEDVVEAAVDDVVDVAGDAATLAFVADPVTSPELVADEAFPVGAGDEVDDLVSAADPREELPWLAASGTPADDMAAIVEAMEQDARASGESDDVVVDELSDDEPAETTESAPAFVTETMGELLVAQGFVDRAVVVYEELVRRRPYDPVLSARLAELQEQVTAAAPVSLYTARERFATLAARRVPRRTPPRAATPVASASITPLATSSITPLATPSFTPASVPVSESLADLFGASAEAQDDDAAQALADAFAPMQVEAGAVVDQFADSFFGDTISSREPTPAYGAMRQPTPIRTAAFPTPADVSPAMDAAPLPTPLSAPVVSGGADFSFDRFFPDPAASSAPAAPSEAAPASPADGEPSVRTSDDLAQFSAWLKGLGNA